MDLNFRFVNENGAGHIVRLPPNLLLAYNTLKRTKRDYIVFGIIGAIIFSIMSCVTSGTLQIIFGILVVACAVLIGAGMANQKANAVKIYACIMTEEFNIYIDEVIDKLSKMLSPEISKITLLDKKDAARINKILITAQKLKEAALECEDCLDLRECVDFIESTCENTFGFIIKEEDMYAEIKKQNKQNKAIKLLVRGIKTPHKRRK